jgi:hypothetical protein
MLGTDGASAMLGKYSGATTFLKTYLPYAIPIHCIAHREALAAQDASDPMADLVDTTMRLSYNYFAHSSKRNLLYDALIGSLDTEDLPELAKIHAVRWLSRGKCLDSFIRNLGPLQVFFLSDVEKKGVGVTADEASKCS